MRTDGRERPCRVSARGIFEAARRAALAGAIVAALSCPAAATVSAGEPAALIVYPHVVVDSSRGLDTVVQLTNASDEPTAVRCTYENTTLTCSGGRAAETCEPPSTCSGACVRTGQHARFAVNLTRNQPLAWRASTGRGQFPLDGATRAGPGGDSNAGSEIPAVSTDPFTGILRCLVTSDTGAPSDRNALAGTATIDHYQAGDPASLDVAQYAATGIAAIAGAPNGDDQLVLGGRGAEYDACPGSVVLQAVLDGTILELGAAGDGAVQHEVSTTLVLATCSQDLRGDGAAAEVEFTLTNELGQQFSAHRTFAAQLITPLSLIDASIPSQSIFNIARHGSPAGQIRITPRDTGSGVLAVALQVHENAGDGRRQTAAFNPQLAGGRTVADVVDLALPPPPSGCIGDCSGDRTVTIDELLRGVRIALDTDPLSVCPAFDRNSDRRVTTDELVTAVLNALNGCPASPALSPALLAGEACRRVGDTDPGLRP